MLRRPATVLTVTSEDVATYEDRRAREALAIAERERALAAAHNKRHLQALHIQLQQQQQQDSAPPPRPRQDFSQHDMFVQQAYLETAPGVPSSPAEHQRMMQAQMLQAQMQQQQQNPGRLHLPPPPAPRGLQQRLAAAAAQGEDDYTEQDTEMLVGSSDEESRMEDASLLAAGDGSVRGRGARRDRPQGMDGVGRGGQRTLQLTPTPAAGMMDAGRGRSRDERITGARRGRGG